MIIDYPEKWEPSTIGFVANDSTINNNINISSVKIFYHNGTNITV
jgi:hypothetical protein